LPYSYKLVKLQFCQESSFCFAQHKTGNVSTKQEDYPKQEKKNPMGGGVLFMGGDFSNRGVYMHPPPTLKSANNQVSMKKILQPRH